MIEPDGKELYLPAFILPVTFPGVAGTTDAQRTFIASPTEEDVYILPGWILKTLEAFHAPEALANAAAITAEDGTEYLSLNWLIEHSPKECDFTTLKDILILGMDQCLQHDSPR